MYTNLLHVHNKPIYEVDVINISIWGYPSAARPLLGHCRAKFQPGHPTTAHKLSYSHGAVTYPLLETAEATDASKTAFFSGAYCGHGRKSLSSVLRGRGWPLLVISEYCHSGHNSEKPTSCGQFTQWEHVVYFSPPSLLWFAFGCFPLTPFWWDGEQKACRQLFTSRTKQKKTTVMQLSNRNSMCLLSWNLPCSARFPRNTISNRCKNHILVIYN